MLTALAAIVGCSLPSLGLKPQGSAWLLVPAACSLALFAWLLSLHPTAAGRVSAAYGGGYITVALLWLLLVDSVLHTVLPLPPRTQFKITRIALGGMEGRITEDNHLVFTLSHQPLKRFIRDIGGGTVPPHDQPPLVEQQTEFAADNPAVIGEAFATDLLGTPAFAHGVDQLNAIGINDPQHRRRVVYG